MGTHIFFEEDLTPEQVSIIAYLVKNRFANKTSQISDDDIIKLALKLKLSVGSLLRIMTDRQ
jgi:hypothetical protein